MAQPLTPVPAPQAPTQEPPPAASDAHQLHETWRLGPCEYTATNASATRRLGSQYSQERAAAGAVFVVLRFTETNRSNETISGLSDSCTLHDTQGRTFRQSSRAQTALAMGSDEGAADLLVSELQPAVPHTSAAAFEVPEDVLGGPMDFVFEERGMLADGHATVRVLPAPAAQDRLNAGRR